LNTLTSDVANIVATADDIACAEDNNGLAQGLEHGLSVLLKELSVHLREDSMRHFQDSDQHQLH